jgi:hypothetical protein
MVFDLFTCQLVNLSTRQLVHSSTCPLVNPSTRQLVNSSTKKTIFFQAFTTSVFIGRVEGELGAKKNPYLRLR